MENKVEKPVRSTRTQPKREAQGVKETLKPEAAVAKVRVQSCVGVMWSPDDKIYIDATPVEVNTSSWLRSQINAGKLVEVE